MTFEYATRNYCVIPILFLAVAACSANFVSAQSEFYLRDVCRLKGQEENVLSGFGLVIGLKGTGDGGAMKPMTRALARSMQLMGGKLPPTFKVRSLIKNSTMPTNVALVFVTATIPPAGAQAGEKYACTVSAISAKSLEGES